MIQYHTPCLPCITLYHTGLPPYTPLCILFLLFTVESTAINPPYPPHCSMPTINLLHNSLRPRNTKLNCAVSSISSPPSAYHPTSGFYSFTNSIQLAISEKNNMFHNLDVPCVFGCVHMWGNEKYHVFAWVQMIQRWWKIFRLWPQVQMLQCRRSLWCEYMKIHMSANDKE